MHFYALLGMKNKKKKINGSVLSPSLKYLNQQIFIIHVDSPMKVLATYGLS